MAEQAAIITAKKGPDTVLPARVGLFGWTRDKTVSGPFFGYFRFSGQIMGFLAISAPVLGGPRRLDTASGPTARRSTRLAEPWPAYCI
jgi:hypothetical protein